VGFKVKRFYMKSLNGLQIFEGHFL
jgi:hypothetical protein